MKKVIRKSTRAVLIELRESVAAQKKSLREIIQQMNNSDLSPGERTESLQELYDKLNFLEGKVFDLDSSHDREGSLTPAHVELNKVVTILQGAIPMLDNMLFMARCSLENMGIDSHKVVIKDWREAN